MSRPDIEAHLGRWVAAGLIDDAAASAIRAHEAAHPQAGRLRWPAAIVIGLGGLLLGAGVLLFVAAHWDRLSPPARYGVVLSTVAGLHLAAAMPRSAALRSTLHAVGTVALGAGVFLVGQIFNLQTQWPAGIFLWAAGALGGAVLLRDWPQVTLLAILAPAWLVAEWELDNGLAWSAVTVRGLFLLALAYLGADARERRSPARRAVGIVGAIALLPLAALLPETGGAPPAGVLPWVVALGLPLVVGALLRSGTASVVAGMAVWVAIGPGGPLGEARWSDLLVYGWFAAAALGVIAWGFRQASPRSINVGIAGFALTVGVFYFSSVMDKLGRSASLVGLGVLFLGGGYALEQARRRLVESATRAA